MYKCLHTYTSFTTSTSDLWCLAHCATVVTVIEGSCWARVFNLSKAHVVFFDGGGGGRGIRIVLARGKHTSNRVLSFIR